MQRALLTSWPELRIPWIALGDFPTPIAPLAQLASRLGHPGAPLFIKRDDLSAPIYGGNKVRTLEVLFARARAEGAERIYATGAFGSNHALATVLHAPRAGLESGVILFPQPPSAPALENLRVVLAQRPRAVALPHWSALPLGMAWTARDRRASIMVPGGATPEGALGYVSAALELAQQVEAGSLPAPRTLVVGVGSTCTSAGLLVGLRAASVLGIGWRTPPTLVSVRVTPWPVTSAYRISALAQRTAMHLAWLTRDHRFAFSRRALAAGLEVDRTQLGKGYGVPTEAGLEALHLLRETEGVELDTTYSAKSAAAAIARTRAGLRGPLVYWSTKSNAPLPPVTDADWRWAPERMTRWIEAAGRCATLTPLEPS